MALVCVVAGISGRTESAKDDAPPPPPPRDSSGRDLLAGADSEGIQSPSSWLPSRPTGVGEGVPKEGRRVKIWRARSRLYRSQILQVNMRLKALVEIYTMHSFAQLQNHIFFKKLVEFAKICENFQKFCEIRNFSNRFFAKILRLQRCKRMQIL